MKIKLYFDDIGSNSLYIAEDLRIVISSHFETVAVCGANLWKMLITVVRDNVLEIKRSFIFPA